MTLFYSPKDPLEVLVLSVDWAGILDGGETIVAGAWTITAEPTEDTTAMKVGTTDISAAPLVRQKVQGGTDGKVYLHRCQITTSAGRTLVQGVQQSVRIGA